MLLINIVVFPLSEIFCFYFVMKDDFVLYSASIAEFVHLNSIGDLVQYTSGAHHKHLMNVRITTFYINGCEVRRCPLRF